MKTQRSHQTAFLAYALGGSKQYTGRSMEKAHSGLNLQEKHFNAIAKHLGDALAAHGVPPEGINAALVRVAVPLRDIASRL